MYDLTGFQRDALYIIAGLDSPHGLAVKEELESYYEQEIHHGRLYPNLDTLCDKGLIEKGQRDRRTNEYTVTQRGHREIEARSDWEEQYLSDQDEPQDAPVSSQETPPESPGVLDEGDDDGGDVQEAEEVSDSNDDGGDAQDAEEASDSDETAETPA